MSTVASSSPAFARFLTQLHASSREKLDGFDRIHFDPLTSVERDEARRLLRAGVASGDAIDALGLVTLDGPAAIPVLRDSLGAYQEPRTPRAMVLGALWQLTRDATYSDALAAIVVDFANTSALTRQTALVELENSPASPVVLAALRRSVRDEPDKTVRFLAAKQLLYAAGLIADVHQREYPQRDLVRGVVDAEGERREAAVRRLEQVAAAVVGQAALTGAGWDLGTPVASTAGRVIVRSKLGTRGKKRRADYALRAPNNQRLTTSA